MRKLRNNLAFLADPALLKLVLFLTSTLLFAAIHNTQHRPSTFTETQLFGPEFPDLTFSPGDKAALVTMLSGLLLVNGLPLFNARRTSESRFRLRCLTG